MANWDVFHSDRLEVERGLSAADVRAALARGDLRDDDLVRPSGTTVPWARLAEMPALIEPEPEPEPRAGREPAEGRPTPEPAPPEEPLLPPLRLDQEQEFEVLGDLDDLRSAVRDEDEEEEAMPVFLGEDEDEDEGEEHPTGFVLDDEEDEEAVAGPAGDYGELDLDLDRDSGSQVALPVMPAEFEEGYDPQDEDEEAAEFTLSRSGPEKVEELDLAAMVDVAFQLVLFFLVTATTVLYKSLEVPKPNPESDSPKATQGKSLAELKDDFILVEIDPSGAMKIDHEGVAAEMNAIVERLRTAREKTGRKAMLLSADYATQHRSAVLAYDAANEIGLGIAIARPAAPSGPAPPAAPARAVRPPPAKAKPAAEPAGASS